VPTASACLFLGRSLAGFRGGRAPFGLGLGLVAADEDLVAQGATLVCWIDLEAWVAVLDIESLRSKF